MHRIDSLHVYDAIRAAEPRASIPGAMKEAGGRAISGCFIVAVYPTRSRVASTSPMSI